MTKTRGGNKSVKGGKAMKGGVGSAAGFGVYEFGGVGSQTNNPLQGNVIAMNPNPAGYTGGNVGTILKKGGSKRRGGTLLADAVVPVALIAANQLYKPSKKAFGKKVSGGGSGDGLTDTSKGGQIDLQLQQAGASNDRVTAMMNAGATTPPPPAIVGAAAAVLPTNVPYAYLSGGGSAEIVKQQVGGVLTDVAVPAVLIAANQLYSRRRRSSKKRSFRRSRKLRYSAKKR